ncbi:MAG: Swt1 family HEPN domain-containing protein [Oscillospiraceae bacterium]|nr:Swt1 family HEPN domain-containing protein [Oscillospiraceae bacterium]
MFFILSARSYITEAFDLLFPALLDYVLDVFSSKENWWDEFFFEELVKADRKSDLKIPKGLTPESWEELLDYFDESSLLKIVTDIYRDVRRHFSPDIRDQFAILLDIRNEWAHRGYKQHKGESYEQREKAWALDSLGKMIETAKTMDYPYIESQLSALKSKMEYDWISNNLELRPIEELKTFLYVNVISQTEESDVLEITIKNRILRSWAELVENAVTPDDIIDYFWNAIKEKTEVYFELKKHNLMTFEDIRAEFAVMCLQEKRSR